MQTLQAMSMKQIEQNEKITMIKYKWHEHSWNWQYVTAAGKELLVIDKLNDYLADAEKKYFADVERR